jgi:hypothetical protein
MPKLFLGKIHTHVPECMSRAGIALWSVYLIAGELKRHVQLHIPTRHKKLHTHIQTHKAQKTHTCMYRQCIEKTHMCAYKQCTDQNTYMHVYTQCTEKYAHTHNAQKNTDTHT